MSISKVGKRVLLALISLCIISTVLVLFLPTIASTGIGKKVVESAISQRIDGEVSIGSWELSWFGPQVIRNAKFKNNEVEFSFSELQAKLPFWSFLTITKLKEPFLNELDGTASLKNGNIALYEKKGSTTYVENLEVNLYANEGEDIKFDIKGDSRTDQVIGSILVDGKIAKTSNIIDSPFPTTVKVITVNFPTRSIGKFLEVAKLKSKNKFIKKLKKDPNFIFAVLGPKVNLDLLISGKDNKGSLALELFSDNLKINFDGSLENNNIYLNKDLHATYFPNKSLDNKVIESFSPLFATDLRAQNPITLTISKEGFISPYSMDINDIKIANGMLNVGKLECKNTKLLAAILTLFKLQKLESLGDVTIWCTPFTFEIRDKKLIANRMDALIADSLHICIYGDINLINDKIDMILGIPADALKDLLKIKGLPTDYVFQIPVKGKLDNPKINLNRVTSKLAVLIATEQKSEKIPDIPELLDILEKFDEKDAPPPSQVFPWQKKG